MLRRRFISTLVAPAALAVLSGLASLPASAQCMPDLLDTVPCCSPISAALPTFPGISQSSKFICFRDCAIQINQNLCVTIDPPQPIATGGAILCGVYTIRFKVRQCGGTMPILWQGNLRAHYARNWQEIDPSGLNHGVWRFLVNGDLKATAFLQSTAAWGSPNVQPGCYSAFNAIYVGGYIDYAQECSGGTWQAAWSLNHDCDAVHHPAGEPRAGAFHPTRTFTFVGPGAGFVVDPVGTPVASGASTGEAMRWNAWSSSPAICRGEEPTSNTFVSNSGPFCFCSTAPGSPGQYERSNIAAVGTCGSFARSSPAPGFTVQKRIGRWSNPLVFPGPEALSLVLADLDFQNACTTIFSREFYEGVSTLGGWFPISYTGIVLGSQQVDLGSSNRSPGSMLRRVGVPHVTQSILNIDLP